MEIKELLNMGGGKSPAGVKLQICNNAEEGKHDALVMFGIGNKDKFETGIQSGGRQYHQHIAGVSYAQRFPKGLFLSKRGTFLHEMEKRGTKPSQEFVDTYVSTLQTLQEKGLDGLK